MDNAGTPKLYGMMGKRNPVLQGDLALEPRLDTALLFLQVVDDLPHSGHEVGTRHGPKLWVRIAKDPAQLLSLSGCIGK
jgi:hypothetical protein